MGSQVITVPSGECWEISLRVTPTTSSRIDIQGAHKAKVIDLELELVRGFITDSTYLEICEGSYSVEWVDKDCLSVEVLTKSTLTEVADVDYEYVCNADTGVYDLHIFTTVAGVPNGTPTIVPTNVSCDEVDFEQVSYCNVTTGSTWIRATGFSGDGTEVVLSEVDTGIRCTPVQIDVEVGYACNTDTNVYDRIVTTWSDGAEVSSVTTATTTACDEDKPDFEQVRECINGTMHVVTSQIDSNGTITEISDVDTLELCNPSESVQNTAILACYTDTATGASQEVYTHFAYDETGARTGVEYTDAENNVFDVSQGEVTPGGCACVDNEITRMYGITQEFSPSESVTGQAARFDFSEESIRDSYTSVSYTYDGVAYTDTIPVSQSHEYIDKELFFSSLNDSLEANTGVRLSEYAGSPYGENIVSSNVYDDALKATPMGVVPSALPAIENAVTVTGMVYDKDLDKLVFVLSSNGTGSNNNYIYTQNLDGTAVVEEYNQPSKDYSGVDNNLYGWSGIERIGDFFYVINSTASTTLNITGQVSELVQLSLGFVETGVKIPINQVDSEHTAYKLVYNSDNDTIVICFARDNVRSDRIFREYDYDIATPSLTPIAGQNITIPLVDLGRDLTFYDGKVVNMTTNGVIYELDFSSVPTLSGVLADWDNFSFGVTHRENEIISYERTGELIEFYAVQKDYTFYIPDGGTADLTLLTDITFERTEDVLATTSQEAETVVSGNFTYDTIASEEVEGVINLVTTFDCNGVATGSYYYDPVTLGVLPNPTLTEQVIIQDTRTHIQPKCEYDSRGLQGFGYFTADETGGDSQFTLISGDAGFDVNDIVHCRSTGSEQQTIYDLSTVVLAQAGAVGVSITNLSNSHIRVLLTIGPVNILPNSVAHKEINEGEPDIVVVSITDVDGNYNNETVTFDWVTRS